MAVWSQISEFLPSWRSRDFEVREMLISPESTGFYLCTACG